MTAPARPVAARLRTTPRRMLLIGALLLIAIVTSIPLLWMLSASFMASGEANAFPPPFFPKHITLEQYRALFTRLHVARYLTNSFLLSVSVTAISLLLNSMAGYAFAKFRFRGRARLFRTLLSALVIPAQVAMLPLFLLLREIGVINTYWGVIIPGMASIFGIFLVRQYAVSIPDDLLDAARIDGASEWRIYWSIVLPVCKPILVTPAIISSVSWTCSPTRLASATGSVYMRSSVSTISGHMKSFQVPMKVKIASVTRIGLQTGSTIDQ